MSITLEYFRKLTDQLPGSWKIVIREQDCDTLEWDDSDVQIAGMQDGVNPCIIILSEAHSI